MENLGNTCFMNSVLQCFIHTVPILHGILSEGHLLHPNCKLDNVNFSFVNVHGYSGDHCDFCNIQLQVIKKDFVCYAPSGI